jgi:hypothetical protein
MEQPTMDNDRVWKKRYVLVLLINLVLIIAFAMIGHFFNR